MQYPSPNRPRAVKLINHIGRGARAMGIRLPSLRIDKLMAQASRETGLSDYGDACCQDGLKQLITALETEAQLSQIGRVAAHAMLVTELSKRLQLIDYRKRRPEVAQQTIKRPLFVVGLPRTGTTILYELLAQDPAHRAPISWEVAQPIPPAQADTFSTDARIADVEKGDSRVETLAPGFRAMHETGARLPQECVSILASNFVSDQFGAVFQIPAYRRWTRHWDMESSYRWHYQFLQHLQVDFMKQRWVLKTPAHINYLDAIVAQYPDAAIVQTHRDPMDVIASVSSLACTLHGAFSDDISPEVVGRCEIEHFSEAVQQGMAQRDAMPDEESRFFDVYFEDIVSDPISAIEKLYQHFAFELSHEAAQAMTTYLDNRPRDKHGRHRYTLEDFGLSRDADGHLFADYCARFGL
jgi:hypothetical protein